MSDPLDDILGTHQKPAFPVAPPQQAGAAMTGDPLEDILGEAPPEAYSETSLGNLARQGLSGLTFGFDDEIVGGIRNGSQGIDEERARKDIFEKAHPVASFGARALGAVAGSFIPTSWLSRFGAAGNAARSALPFVQTNRIAGATIPRAIHEAGKIGAKGALWQSLGDAEGGVPERLARVAENAPSNAALGYVVGMPFGYFGRGAANVAGDLEQASRLGLGHEAAAASSLKETMAAQGRTVPEVVSDMVTRNNLTSRMPPDHVTAIINAHAEIAGNGGNAILAKKAAADAYQALRPTTARGTPVSRKAIEQRVASVISSFDDSFAPSGPQMVAAERLSGTQKPIQGALKGVTQQLANSPGEARSIASNVLSPRQEAATGRARNLITENLGPTDYTQHIIDLKRASKDAKGFAYGMAQGTAKEFDISPVIAKHAEIARKSFGTPGDELNAAGKSVMDWWQRIPKPTQADPPDIQKAKLADLLNSYRQVRTGIGESIEALKSTGVNGRGRSPEAAKLLVQLKRDLDATVARKNRIWWKANRLAADDFAIERAADKGRNLALKEGAPVQDAKHWYRSASIPERKAFERGLARQFHDKISPQGDTHDVSKAFLNGDFFDDEGMRGLIRTVMGDKRATKFLAQMERERTALSTFRLDKGSQSAALLAEQDKRTSTARLMTAMRYGLNPLGILEDLGKNVAGRAAEARDAALAKRLFSTDKDAFLKILREIQAAEAPPSKALSGAFGRIPEAVSAVAPGAFYDHRPGRKREARQ